MQRWNVIQHEQLPELADFDLQDIVSLNLKKTDYMKANPQ